MMNPTTLLRTRRLPFAASSRPWGFQASFLSAVTIIVSGGNYAFSLVVIHLLRPAEFARFSAAQGLLLVLGSGCMAAIPWAVARYIALGTGRRAKQEALHFGLAAALVQGIIAAPIAGLVLGLTADPAIGVITATAAFALSLVAAPVGFLQGEGRVVSIANIRVIEWAIRAGVGLTALLLVSRTATSALIGFPVGSFALVALGVHASRAGFPLQRGGRSVERALVRQSLHLGGIQVFLSMLGAFDTVTALASHFGGSLAGSYQAAALLGRIPLFLSTAVSLAAYTHLARARYEKDVEGELMHALVLYLVVTLPYILVCWTVPSPVLGHLLPNSYPNVRALLRFTSVSGAAVGWINIVSTAHQARARFRPALIILGLAAVLQPLVLIVVGRTFGIWAFAVCLVGISLAAALAVTMDAHRWIRLRVPLLPTLGLGLIGTSMAIGTRSTSIWSLATLALGATTVFLLRSTLGRGVQ